MRTLQTPRHVHLKALVNIYNDYGRPLAVQLQGVLGRRPRDEIVRRESAVGWGNGARRKGDHLHGSCVKRKSNRNYGQGVDI